MLRAGTLNRRITIQKPGTERDAAGQLVGGWVDVATVWANIAHKSGLETIRADALVSSVRASIRIRFREGIDASMRVLYGTNVYDIRAVMPDAGGREFVDMVCEMRNADEPSNSVQG